MNSKISVLIPAFNTGRYIAECIESIIAQTYRNLEIIIVDDGSIDDTKAIAEHYALNDSRINVDTTIIQCIVLRYCFCIIYRAIINYDYF